MINCFQFLIWGLIVFIIKAEIQLSYEVQKMAATTNKTTSLVENLPLTLNPNKNKADLEHIREYSPETIRASALTTLRPRKFRQEMKKDLNTKIVSFTSNTSLIRQENETDLQKIPEYSSKTYRSQKFQYQRNLIRNFKENLGNSLKSTVNKADLLYIREYSPKTVPAKALEASKPQNIDKQSKGVLNTKKVRSTSNTSLKPTENKVDLQEIREYSLRTIRLTSKPSRSEKPRNTGLNMRNLRSNSTTTLKSLENNKDLQQIREYSSRTKRETLKPSQIQTQRTSAFNVKNLRSNLVPSLITTKNKVNWNYILQHSREFKEDLTKTLTKTPKIIQILQENLTVTKLKSFESFLKVDTIVLFGSRETLRKSSQIFSPQHPPRLIISEGVEDELRNLFSSNILSIVFLDSRKPLEKSLLNTVKKSLNRRHLKKLIFITESSIAESPKPPKELLELFNWLHDQGFWNSLLMDLEGNSLAFADLSRKFIWNITLPEFLQVSIKWSDLKGFPIRCSMGSNPPRTYIYHDSSHEVSLKGYYGTIINLFVKYYNATLKPFILTNMDYYTELDCVSYIKQRKVDICGDVLTINPEYVITQPDEISASYLMVPYDKPLARFYYFLKPFQLHVWTIVNCSFFYKVLTLSFIHRMQHGYWNASQQILYATLSVMFLPFHLTRVKGPYRKFLELIMILVGFVVANWYLSVLSSLLFTRLYSQDIKSLQDLAHHNISIMVNDFDVYLLNATENNPIIMQQLQVVSNDVLQHHRRIDAYYSQSDKIEFYLHQQKFLLRPRMKVLTGIPPINEALAGIPMSPNWPFQHLLNDFMRRIAVSGLYQRLLVNAREEGILTGYLHYFPTEHHYVEPLSIEYFQMPAMLLAGGYSLALVGFLLEIFVFKEF